MRHVAASVGKSREGSILEAIEFGGGGKSLVFGSTRNEVDLIASRLPNARALHGGLIQSKRDKVLADFRQGKFQVLVASDVASRGLDIDAVKTVVHTRSGRMPVMAEDYVHRSGRVGRAGVPGTSVFLHSAGEERVVSALERQVGIKFERLRLTGEHASLPVNNVTSEPDAEEREPRERRDRRDERGERRNGGDGREVVRRDGGERRRFDGGERRRSSDGEGRRDFGRDERRRTSDGDGRRSFGSDRRKSYDGESRRDFGGESFLFLVFVFKKKKK